jgi:Mlc titration factor MtfA (ptsG expression regulator)
LHNFIIFNFMEIKVYIIAGILIAYILIRAMVRNNFSLAYKNECTRLFDEDKVPNLRKVLRDNFVVYRMLGEKERQLFERRVWRFIKMKDFRAANSLGEVTDEMRVMVAASAIQITFGYPGVYFNHFQTIILFAEEYYSTITGQYHEGEVNAGGAIVLSWKNFKSGFSNLTDGRNLALHEMAHALQLTNIVDNDEYDFIDRYTMQSFEVSALEEIRKIENNENSFFRSYGAANKEEFFSVAVECFFEQPKEFQSYNPRLYLLLTKILKLDLLNFGRE